MSNFDKFYSDVSSGYWWTTVVVVGLLINLASGYLKPFIDRWYEGFAASAQARRAKANADYSIEVRLLARHHGLLLVKGLDEMRWRLSTVVFAILSIGILLAFEFVARRADLATGYSSAAFWASRLLASLFMIMAMWTHTHAIQARLVIHGARIQIMKSLLNDRPAIE